MGTSLLFALLRLQWLVLEYISSGMSYCGSNTIEETWRNARFVRQTEAGYRESGPHDVGSF